MKKKNWKEKKNKFSKANQGRKQNIDREDKRGTPLERNKKILLATGE